MNTRTILIVDDDADLAETLSDVLSTKGYTPLAANGGRKALELFEKQRPAAALIDLKLSDMSGIEVIDKMKKRAPHFECILLTGYASQNSAIEAVNVGAYSYLQKPYDIDQLLVTLKRAIEKSEAEEALKQKTHDLENSQRELSRKLQEIGDSRRAILNILADVEESRNELKASLEEKETLLKEIHHRVKNNLQVISSLLHLQSKKITDEAVLTVFRDSENRVKSMAIIHENLYKSTGLARIDFSNYIKSLTGILYESYGIGTERVSLNIDVENIFFNIDTAVPCGLIINELVSNAMKHAFPDNREGSITISLGKADGDRYTLTVSDDGAGLPKGFDMKKSQSLGMRLVHNLVQNQLRGTIEIVEGTGMTFIITFSEVTYKRRI